MHQAGSSAGEMGEVVGGGGQQARASPQNGLSMLKSPEVVAKDGTAAWGRKCCREEPVYVLVWTFLFLKGSF